MIYMLLPQMEMRHIYRLMEINGFNDIVEVEPKAGCRRFRLSRKQGT